MVTTLVHALRSLSKKRILILGDLVVDIYTMGSVQRISPEAPVAVMRVEKESMLPGMAGNVALNCVALGSEAFLMARVGDDKVGFELLERLREEGVDVTGCCRQQHYVTPSKNRLVANGQQLVRLDREQVTALTEQEQQAFLERLDQLLPTMDLLVLSDYGKGFFAPPFLQAIMQRAKQYRLRVLVDPKGIDFTRYKGATVVKPNMGEALAAAGLGPDAALNDVAKKLLEITRAELIMITRAQEGAALFTATGERQDFPVLQREVKDVTGAGDTVLAMLACALASGLPYGAAAQLCNHAAGIAIERFGCAKVSLSDIVKRLLMDEPRYKLFDADHLFVLHEALAQREVILLVLDGHSGIMPSLYRWMREIAEGAKKALVVYVQGMVADVGLIEMLISLREVAFVIYQGVDLKHVCEMVSPKQLFAFSEGRVHAMTHEKQCV